ncbi:hypothetical protein DXG03_008580, partial [Asterophora parasitica]
MTSTATSSTSDETAQHPIFPTKETLVEAWYGFLANSWADVSPQGVLFRSRYSELCVEEVRRYKKVVGSQHEFIVFQVRDWNGGYLYFSIERSFNWPKDVKAAHSQGSRSTPTLSEARVSTISLSSNITSIASTTSLSSVVQPPAKDTVKPVEGLSATPAKEFVLIERTHFQNIPIKPTLLDILLISHLTHKNSDRYRLFLRQCFWFSIVITTVLRKEFPGVLETLVADDLEDAEMDPNIPMSPANSPYINLAPAKPSGYWRAFKIQDVLPKQAIPIHEEFRKLRSEILQKAELTDVEPEPGPLLRPIARLPLRAVPAVRVPAPPTPAAPVPPPPASSPPAPVPTPQSSLSPPAVPTPAAPRSKNDRNKVRSKARRAAQATLSATARMPVASYRPRSTPSLRATGPTVIPAKLASEGLPAASGRWVGKRVPPSQDTPWTLDMCLAQGFKLISFTERVAHVVTGRDGRGIVFMVGKSNDDSWSGVIAAADELIMNARIHGEREGLFKPEQVEHRRGKFVALAAGVSYGGGQTKPGNLKHPDKVRDLLDSILGDSNIKRIAGFQSSERLASILLSADRHLGAFAYYAPKIYKNYVAHLEKLYEHDQGLKMNFSNRVFPAITINFGPDTVTLDHTDSGNVVY